MLTSTEALAETKTINARLAKRQESVMRYLARDARMRDPLEGDGGSIEFVRRERQAIRDLGERLVLIRTAIQEKNLTTPLTVQEQTRTVSGWLNWRREVSASHRQFLSAIAGAVSQYRAKAAQQGATIAASDAAAKTPGDIIVSVSEVELSGEIEQVETILGELDGKLSLLNATTTLDI